ncbi:MAG: hypothetical protein O9264_16175 [Leptospira sp.]|nr:hypothetical protein [Leptospira sp.]
MKSTNIITNLEVSSPINYSIEIDWGKDTDRFFKLEIFNLPSYSNKIPSNDVVDIGNGHLVGFMPQLAIGLGTGRLALPSVSSENKTILLHFTSEFLEEMDNADLLLLQKRISSTLNSINSKLSLDEYYLEKLEVPK